MNNTRLQHSVNTLTQKRAFCSASGLPRTAFLNDCWCSRVPGHCNTDTGWLLGAEQTGSYAEKESTSWVELGSLQESVFLLQVDFALYSLCTTSLKSKFLSFYSIPPAAWSLPPALRSAQGVPATQLTSEVARSARSLRYRQLPVLSTTHKHHTLPTTKALLCDSTAREGIARACHGIRLPEGQWGGRNAGKPRATGSLDPAASSSPCLITEKCQVTQDSQCFSHLDHTSEKERWRDRREMSKESPGVPLPPGAGVLLPRGPPHVPGSPPAGSKHLKGTIWRTREAKVRWTPRFSFLGQGNYKPSICPALSIAKAGSFTQQFVCPNKTTQKPAPKQKRGVKSINYSNIYPEFFSS